MKALALALTLAAAPAAAQVAVVDVTARGIEDAIRQLSQFRDNRQAQQAALVLTILRGVGRPVADSGRARLDYKIEVQPDGRLLINDLDVTAILDMANRRR